MGDTDRALGGTAIKPVGQMYHQPPGLYHLIIYNVSHGRYIPGMCGAEYFPAGRDEDKNPRGGAKVKIRGAGQKNA